MFKLKGFGGEPVLTVAVKCVYVYVSARVHVSMIMHVLGERSLDPKMKRPRIHFSIFSKTKRRGGGKWVDFKKLSWIPMPVLRFPF